MSKISQGSGGEVQRILPVEYTDEQIVSYVRTRIIGDLGGFAQDRQYLLQNTPNGILTAFADPVNAGPRLVAQGHQDVVSTPISYMFDKNSRPPDERQYQILQLLGAHDEAIVEQARFHHLESISGLVGEDETASTLREKLGVEFDRIQNDRRDIFDEIMPAMNGGHDTARIIFPYNTRGGGHWVTGEININRTLENDGSYRYAINMTAHDPFGRGSGIGAREAQELANAVSRRIAAEHNAQFGDNPVGVGNFQVTSVLSPYRNMDRQHDAVSCGVISSEEMLFRLGNQDIPHVQYPPNAMELRQHHIDIMQQAHGVESPVYQNFMHEYQAAAEVQSKQKQEALSLPTATITTEEKGVAATSSPQADGVKKPLFQQRSADIFTKDAQAIGNNLEAVKVKVEAPKVKAQRGQKKVKPKATYVDHYRHIGDPEMQQFPTREECIAHATKHVDEWKQQLLQIRDVTARVLEEASRNEPNTLGQPKNYEEAVRPIQQLASLLHNQTVPTFIHNLDIPESEKKSTWGYTKENEKIREETAFGATTVNVSVIKESPKSKPKVIVLENGKDSNMTPFRRRGVELAGGEHINISDMQIGPWTMSGRLPNRDGAEAFPDERISVISNVVFKGKETRHAEANTISYLFSQADGLVRQEQLEVGTIQGLYDPIDPNLVKERVQGMLLDTATDKCHCAECTMAMKAVFGKTFNSGTPTEDRLFENWREPFPGFYELYGESPYREMNGQFKQGFGSGVIAGKQGIDSFNANDLPSISSSPKSPSHFYDDVVGPVETGQPKGVASLSIEVAPLVQRWGVAITIEQEPELLAGKIVPMVVTTESKQTADEHEDTSTEQGVGTENPSARHKRKISVDVAEIDNRGGKSSRVGGKGGLHSSVANVQGLEDVIHGLAHSGAVLLGGPQNTPSHPDALPQVHKKDSDHGM